MTFRNHALQIVIVTTGVALLGASASAQQDSYPVNRASSAAVYTTLHLQAVPDRGMFRKVGMELIGYDVGYGNSGPSTAKAKSNIIETAGAAGGFDTLLTAIEAAGLTDTLERSGPYTVFAPTDEAFGKIPQQTLSELLNDKEALTKILTYHVVPGRVMAKDVVGLKQAKTLEGQSIRIDTKDGVRVDDANVLKTDIIASNGVIHVIDSVILPN